MALNCTSNDTFEFIHEEKKKWEISWNLHGLVKKKK